MTQSLLEKRPPKKISRRGVRRETFRSGNPNWALSIAEDAEKGVLHMALCGIFIPRRPYFLAFFTGFFLATFLTAFFTVFFLATGMVITSLKGN